MQAGKHKYYGRKTKKAANKCQRQHKLIQNACRIQGSRRLVKGYNQMPHDNAVQVPNSDTFVPTIFVDSVAANSQFDKDYPAAERQHGFMVSCKGMVLYWNTLTNDFGTELVALNI